ncbi:hypothetical protein RUM44_007816 [Polyplax serrata]|uniref:Uncharacterized protein n=1 Tax=Polyplax serrata TaxID=468196 RepID=A0ABR1BAK5_POLSC
MAKSIRSKRKRKMRAIKRVRYAEKELAILKRTVGVSDDQEMKDSNTTAVMQMDVSGMEDANVRIEGNVIEFSLKPKQIQEAKTKEGVLKKNDGIAFASDVKKDEVISAEDIKKLGGYPKWMNQKQIQKISRLNKRNRRRIQRIGKLKKSKL